MPGMMARRSGRIVVTASTFSRQGNDINPAYVASKWAVVGLVKSAAIEAGRSGVTVNAIAPTAVRTGLGGPQAPEARARADEWLKANYHKMDVGILEPEDVAGSVVFLASPAARYITGEVIDIAAGANARYTAERGSCKVATHWGRYRPPRRARVRSTGPLDPRRLSWFGDPMLGKVPWASTTARRGGRNGAS
jgi:short-subunit dehydrogenase